MSFGQVTPQMMIDKFMRTFLVNSTSSQHGLPAIGAADVGPGVRFAEGHERNSSKSTKYDCYVGLLH